MPPVQTMWGGYTALMATLVFFRTMAFAAEFEAYKQTQHVRYSELLATIRANRR
jgi:hypothetical protein